MLRTHGLSLSLACALTACVLGAQSRNVTLLGSFRPVDRFGDVIGHVDPLTGKEYAFLMGERACYVVDCDDPTNPVQTGSIPAAASGWRRSIWRDGRIYGDYLYLVTEGGGGMQIVDIADLSNPTLVTTFQPAGIDWANTHNVSIDPQTGVLYACGTSGGMHVFDLSVDPINPSYVTSYVTEYVHDCQAQDGILHVAEINRERYRLLDVSNLPTLTSISAVGKNNCHNVWPSRDGQFAASSGEDFGGDVTFFDIRNRALPLPATSYRTGLLGTSVHNVYLHERMAHMSYYSEGYRLVDFSDPTRPVEVGFYDTHPGTTGLLGAWGCYPFQPSGVVYVSDMDFGLFLLDPLGATERYGAGTPDGSGTIPRLHTAGAAFVDNPSFRFEVEGGPVGAPAMLVVGGARAATPLLGVTVLVDTLGAIGVSFVTDGSGEAELPVPIPNDPGLVGLRVHCQVLAGGVQGITASQALTVDLFSR